LADTDHVTPLPRRDLPDAIELPTDVRAASLTPNEMRAVKAASGMRLDALFDDETDSDDKTQAMVFVALLRAGYSPSWTEAGDVRPVVGEGEAPDPTRTAR
jgi:hypothetical protein